MRRKTAALLCCLLLLLQLAVPPAKAENSVYFTAVSESVLPLADDTMPFWKNGYLYIPVNIFTGNAWRSLEISYVYLSDQTVILCRGNRSLTFEGGKDRVKGSDGVIRRPGMVERGGIPFVPAALVASFFDLKYSVMTVPRGHLVWLRRPNFGLSEAYFADAASSNMEFCYNQYLKAKTPPKPPAPPTPPKPKPPVIADPVRPVPPAHSVHPVDTVEEPKEPEKTISGKRLYLCMEGSSRTQARLNGVLDELQRRNVRATFFCTVDFLEQQGDLLRRMMASGHPIGILVQCGDQTHSAEEQLRLGNQALKQATCSKTRLVYLRNADETAWKVARRAGFCCLQPDLDRSGYGMLAASNVDSFLKRTDAVQGKQVTVWLADRAGPAGIRAFLTAAGQAEDQFSPLTERSIRR